MNEGINQQTNQQINPDQGGIGWGLLGCCVPMAGLVLYLVWKDEKPKTAKAAGKGAMICIILGAVYWVLYFILMFAIAILSNM